MRNLGELQRTQKFAPPSDWGKDGCSKQERSHPQRFCLHQGKGDFSISSKTQLIILSLAEHRVMMSPSPFKRSATPCTTTIATMRFTNRASKRTQCFRPSLGWVQWTVFEWDHNWDCCSRLWPMSEPALSFESLSKGHCPCHDYSLEVTMCLKPTPFPDLIKFAMPWTNPSGSRTSCGFIMFWTRKMSAGKRLPLEISGKVCWCTLALLCFATHPFAELDQKTPQLSALRNSQVLSRKMLRALRAVRNLLFRLCEEGLNFTFSLLPGQVFSHLQRLQ